MDVGAKRRCFAGETIESLDQFDYLTYERARLRFPGWGSRLKVPKIKVAVLLLLLAVAGGLLAYGGLGLEPIERHVEAESQGKWGVRVSLIPDVFPQGSPKETVERELETAGFAQASEDLFWASRHYAIEGGRVLYTREANTWVCNIKLYVVVAFDGTGKLASAEGAQHEHGCL